MRKNNNRVSVFPRMYTKLKRGPQVILAKDIGIILAYTEASKEQYMC